ncbi:MAG: hypothetical protein AAGF94_15700, partial [Pseudomonadota bacterium]
MTKAYSDDLRERVVAAMQSAVSCRRVAARFGVVPSSVVKWTDQARRTACHSNDPRSVEQSAPCRAEALACSRPCLGHALP